MSAAIGLGLAFLLDIEQEGALAEAACAVAMKTGCRLLHERLGDRVLRVERVAAGAAASAVWLPDDEAAALIAAEPTIYHPLSYDDAFALLDEDLQLAVPEPSLDALGGGRKHLIEVAGQQVVCIAVADLIAALERREAERRAEGDEIGDSLADALARAKRYLDVCARHQMTFHVGWEA